MLLIVVLSMFFAFSSANAQGKIFTKKEADSLYGPVKTKVSISKNVLKKYITKCKKAIMFNIIDGKIVILDDSRKALTKKQVKEDQTMNVYGIDMVNKLIENTKSTYKKKTSTDVIYFELREKVFSVTYGNQTLEMSKICPPYCS